MTNTQNTAPERIWLQLGAGDYGTHTWCDQPQDWADENGEGEPEYIRADIHERLVAEAVAAALEEAINRVNGCDRVSEVQPAIRALIAEYGDMTDD